MCGLSGTLSSSTVGFGGGPVRRPAGLRRSAVRTKKPRTPERHSRRAPPTTAQPNGANDGSDAATRRPESGGPHGVHADLTATTTTATTERRKSDCVCVCVRVLFRVLGLNALTHARARARTHYHHHPPVDTALVLSAAHHHHQPTIRRTSPAALLRPLAQRAPPHLSISSFVDDVLSLSPRPSDSLSALSPSNSLTLRTLLSPSGYLWALSPRL